MKDSIVQASTTPLAIPQPTFVSRFIRQHVLRRLQGLRYGSLTLIDGNETLNFGATTDHCSVAATLTVHDARFYSGVAFGGSIGAGEAYMQRWWTCDDLTTLVRILVRNREVLDGMEGGLARVTAPLRKLSHWLRRNTVYGSRRNIVAHYDLGNEFFALFLDETMTYSCGIFEHADSTLKDASMAKIDRICRKLQLRPTDHLLEIGSGWGSFALHAAQQYGCQITTTTISPQQYQLVQQRVTDAGLTDRITVLLQDYRQLTGQFDKLVSVEMIEAVGHAFYNTYFACCSRLLKPDGMMVLQAITITDQYYEVAKRSVDFIQQYIFPGSCIPSLSAIAQSVTQSTDMRIVHIEEITPHYAETLRHWRERFLAKLAEVRAQGYPEEFIRMWEFYLCYCEGGFRERAIGDVQIVFAKPWNRRSSILPSLSAS